MCVFFLLKKVLPGPCGMYKHSAIYDEAIPFYCDTLRTDPSNAGALVGSLLLAEDRVLSYAAIMKTPVLNASTALVPEAVFYFDAETNFVRLLTQRRRWINGTVAGYIWLMVNIRLILHANISNLKKIMIVMLTLCQLMMYAIMAMSPSFVSLLLYFSISGEFFTDNSTFRPAFAYLYLFVYIVFSWWHATIPEGTKKKLSTTWFPVIAHMNGLLSIWFVSRAVMESISNGLSVSLIIVLSVLGLPFVLAFMSSLSSWWKMIKNFPGFLYCLPTFTAFFGAYAFSRIHDLSWGNRPSVELNNSAITTQVNETKRRLKRTSHSICLMLIGLNILLTSTIIFLVTFSDNRIYVFCLLMGGLICLSIIGSTNIRHINLVKRIRSNISIN